MVTVTQSFCLSTMASKGAPDGWNNSNPGYVNNTRIGPGRSGETDPDRHCTRPSKGGLKCEKCSHYYRVAKGFCANCGHSNR